SLGITTTDDSRTAFRIEDGPFEKTVYAINGNILPQPVLPPLPCLGPGDCVTFRLTKYFPSGDAENVVVHDFPPLPVLKVSNPLGSGGCFGGSSWNPLPGSGSLPPCGSWSRGSLHSIPTALGPSFLPVPTTPNE